MITFETFPFRKSHRICFAKTSTTTRLWTFWRY